MLARYKMSLVIGGICVTLLYGFAVVSTLAESLYLWAAVFTSFIVFWWLSSLLLMRSRKPSVLLSLFAVLAAWLPLAWIFASTIKESGGSFLEVLVWLGLLPVTITLILGAYAYKAQRKEAKERKEAEQILTENE